MVEELPLEYDAIVLGTGFPESVAAAALSRVGNSVLHLDRNDYYSGQWVTLTFDGLEKWIELNQSKGSKETVETGTHQGEAPSLEPGTYSIPVPSSSHEISNIVVKSYFCEKQRQQACDEVEPPTTSLDARRTDSNLDSKEAVDPGTSEENDIAQATGLAKDLSLEESDNNSTEGKLDGNNDAEIYSNEIPECSDDSAQAESTSETFLSEVRSTEETVGENSAAQQEEAREKKAGININMTYEDLKPYWRRFNIDVAPKLLFSRGPLVETLISANISHYAEFKALTRILTYLEEQVQEVPCSRADVFSSDVISIVEKRMLMKFLTFCLDFEDKPEQYEEFKDKPFLEYLQSRRLTPNLQHFVVHAIAMVKPNTSTALGLKATQRFLQSLGRYGNTPFIWPLYGSGELPQAFCRMCAVFGGLYCLRRGASAIVVDDATKQCTGVISNNQLLKCKWLIMEHSYVPEELRKECTQSVSRAVFITSCSLKVGQEEHITLLSVPPPSAGGEPIRVMELGPAAMACPKGVYVVHLVCKGSSSAKEDLEQTASCLFHFPTQGDLHGEKPTVLWSLYFNQAVPDSSCITDIPSNVYVTSLPGTSVGFSEGLQQAKGIFEKICPGEEFLPAIPNPEDIILDDFLQDANQNATEPQLEDEADAVNIPVSQEEPASTDPTEEHPGGAGARAQPNDVNVVAELETSDSQGPEN